MEECVHEYIRAGEYRILQVLQLRRSYISHFQFGRRDL